MLDGQKKIFTPKSLGLLYTARSEDRVKDQLGVQCGRNKDTTYLSRPHVLLWLQWTVADDSSKSRPARPILFFTSRVAAECGG